MKPNNFFNQKCSSGSVFRLWVEWLTPFHELTKRERDVMARVLAQYFKLREKTSDPAIITEMLWSSNSKKDMRESLHVSPAHFNIIISKLKKNGVLEKDGSIVRRYIPNLDVSDTRFFMLICFDWSSDKQPVDGK